jgi:hypothetical protein
MTPPARRSVRCTDRVPTQATCGFPAYRENRRSYDRSPPRSMLYHVRTHSPMIRHGVEHLSVPLPTHQPPTNAEDHRRGRAITVLACPACGNPCCEHRTAHGKRDVSLVLIGPKQSRGATAQLMYTPRVLGVPRSRRAPVSACTRAPGGTARAATSGAGSTATA